MNRREKEALLREQLREGLSHLEQSLDLLVYSHRKCSRSRPARGRLSPSQLESWEAFCARFARASDLLIQKVFTTVFLLLKEPQTAIIDRIQRAEKLGLIRSADILLEIRDVRNQIAHEYAEEDLIEVFKSVRHLTPALRKAAAQTLAFARSRF